MKLSCPRCGCKDVQRAHQRGLIDLLARRFQIHPFRCRSCRRRFRRVTHPKQPLQAEMEHAH